MSRDSYHILATLSRRYWLSHHGRLIKIYLLASLESRDCRAHWRDRYKSSITSRCWKIDTGDNIVSVLWDKECVYVIVPRQLSKINTLALKDVRREVIVFLRVFSLAYAHPGRKTCACPQERKKEYRKSMIHVDEHSDMSQGGGSDVFNGDKTVPFPYPFAIWRTMPRQWNISPIVRWNNRKRIIGLYGSTISRVHPTDKIRFHQIIR